MNVEELKSLWTVYCEFRALKGHIDSAVHITSENAGEWAKAAMAKADAVDELFRDLIDED